MMSHTIVRHDGVRAMALLGLVGTLGLCACSSGDGRRSGDAGRRDAASDANPTDGAQDSAVDTGPGMSCTADADCDDGNRCTIDSCAVGGVCRHLTEDSFCTAGEHCDAVRGCTTEGCSVAADCDNGIYCDGPENCVRGFCVPTRAVSCDDGNECTNDSCDETASGGAGGCTYAIAGGCDAGVPMTDSGTPAVPFDPTMHYAGTFIVVPAPSLGCSSSTYAISAVTFSTVGSTLTVTGDRFRMTQSPIPTGPTFAVTGTDGNCPTVGISGTFDDSNTLHATWNANCGALCGTHMDNFVGVRRD